MTGTDIDQLAIPTGDGRTLHAERLGSGSPAVVFEAGMGASRNTWGAIAPVVAERTTAVVYDRSGMGRSAPADGPRRLGQLADDLLDVIDHVGTGPVVLVGHSWGGPIIRRVAARRPELVVGLVLVDQSDEHCELFFNGSMDRQVRISRWLMPALARVGLLSVAVRRLAKDLPEPWRSAMRREDGTRQAVTAQLSEMESCVDDLRTLRDEPPTPLDVPVSVISGTRVGFLEKGRRGPLLDSHRQTARELPQGRHVTATRSSHYVPFTEPEIVVAEISRILDRSTA